MNIPFVGPTYNPSSVNIDCQRSVNWYPEINPQSSKAVVSMTGTPGTTLFCASGASTVRGLHAFNNLMFVVIANHLYSIDASGALSGSLGDLNTVTGRVSIKDNGVSSAGLGGDQLIIVDGLNGYIYNVSTYTFSVIPVAGGFVANPIAVEFIDGYFVVAFNNSMKYSVSDLYNGLSWNALATSPVSATSDPIIGVANVHEQLWFLKQFNSEAWYNAGVATSSGSPFVRISGAVVDYGLVSPWAVCRADNTIFWMAVVRNGDESSLVGVVKLNGYTPEPITPPAIAYRMGLWTTLSDVISYSYTQSGHTFCVFTSPTHDQTFVYDTTTGMWHERSTWKGNPYSIGRHLSDSYCFFAGKHCVTDYRNGNVLEFREDVYTDYNTPAVDPLVSIRQTQHQHEKNGMMRRVFYHRLQVDMETGVEGGTDSPSAALSWSDDGGHTWGSESVLMGGIGEFKKRMVWKRLGSSRDRVFRLMISDPVKRVLLGAYAE